MKKIIYKLSIVFILLSTSCSTGYNLYKQGDYYKACLEAINRLRSSPDNNKAQLVLSKAYPLAIQNAEREINNINLIQTPDKYDRLVEQYFQINQLSKEIRTCPKALELIPNTSEYIVELENAKKMAAEQAYIAGTNALAINSLESARTALQHFSRCNNYVPGYKDVQQQINKSKYLATLRVIVQRPLTNNKYQYSADFFYSNLLSEMTRTNKNRLIRFYSPDEASAERMNDPHQIISLNFEDFSIGNVRETFNTTELSRDSVIVGTTTVNGKKYNSYGTVKAKFTLSRREISSGGVLNVRVINAANNREIDNKNFAGQYVWTCEWGSFNGDERALSETQKKLTGQRPQNPPVNQDFFIEFTKPIYNQVVDYFRYTYKNN